MDDSPLFLHATKEMTLIQPGNSEALKQSDAQ